MANVSREWDNDSIEDCCVGFPSTTSDTLLNSLPHLDILMSNSNIPSLSDIDMDQQIPSNNNNNNIYSGSSTHRSVFQGGPVIYIYIIHGKLYYAYLKTIKYLQMDYI